MKHYDALIIGGGGGTKLVSPAAKMGYKVAVVEREKLGGTCLNRGCIPSKMLIHAADVATTIRNAHRFEISIQAKPDVLFKELVTRVTKTIDDESDSIIDSYSRNSNIEYYPYHATFLNNKEVEVNGEVLTADKIFIPVGADVKVPAHIDGLDEVPFLTYREALRGTTLPKSLVVIGGGYIATELGYFYGALGAEIHFLVRSSMLKKEDQEIQKEFTRVFTKQFDVRFGAVPISVEYKNGTYRITYKDGENATNTIESDALLVATGIKANTENLGLENTDVQIDDKGFIKVDEYLQTDAKGIWAFGDAIGRNMYRHTANYEGEYLFSQLFEEAKKKPINYSPIPHAVFTHPQIAGVGKTEEQLKQEGIEYIVGLNAYKDSAMGMALLSEEGFVKLLFDKNSKKLLSGHIVGEEASNMIHMIIAYMKMGATIDDFLDTIFIHPALPEVVRNAARKAKHSFECSEGLKSQW